MTIPIELTDTELARYWAKIDVRGPNDCWEWQGARDRDSYGLFSVWGKGHWKAHRIAYHLGHGDAGKMTCHTCDNPQPATLRTFIRAPAKITVVTVIKRVAPGDASGSIYQF